MSKPRSPFEENFDGKVGDVAAGTAPVTGVAPTTSVAPVTPVVAPRVSAPAVVAAAAASVTGSTAPAQQFASNSTLEKLLEYLILKEGREAAAAEQAEERRKQIQRQRDRNSKDQDSKILLKQARCKHLKGGKKGPKTQNKDHAVYQFQFIDFSTYIRCRICGMKWFPKDTTEYLVRIDKNGKERKISNHTHKGWREAMEMCDASTDTLATSERIPQVAPNANNLDAAGLEFENRFVDKVTGEPVEGVQI